MANAKSISWSMIMMMMLLLFIATSIEARFLSVGGKETKHEGGALTHKGTLEGVEAAASVGETSRNMDGGKSLKAAATTFVDGGSVSTRVESVERIPHDDTGFVAFNADYHHPRHHPPKNN